jgi:hypothetical protein
MTKNALNTAGRASSADLQTLAAQGVQRALAARAQGMRELNAEQVQAVSGAASLLAFDDYCGTGVRPLPKLGGSGGLGGGVVVIINGQFPQINPAAFKTALY